MKITAITQDQVIIINSRPALVAEIGGYHMHNGEWAVHFDTDMGIGHIEYLDNRLNRTIEQAEFDKHYSWLIEEHQKYIDHQAEQQRLIAEQIEREHQENEQNSIDSDTTSDSNGGTDV